jgi:hypothetical protein
VRPFGHPSLASSIFSGKPFIFRLISSLSSSTLFSVSAFSEQAFNPRGIHVGGKLPLPGLPKDGEHLLYQSPTLIRWHVPGVDGQLFGLNLRSTACSARYRSMTRPTAASIFSRGNRHRRSICSTWVRLPPPKHCRPHGYVGRVVSDATPGFA